MIVNTAGVPRACHIEAMLARLAFALALLASPAGADDAALLAYLKTHAKSPEAYVVSKFADHDIVFIGEFHRIRHDPLLIQKLIPRLYAAGVYSLGIEFGDYDLQDKVDSLITADRYDEQRTREILFHWSVSWPYKEYEDIYRAAWEVNHALPKGAQRFRVVNLGYRAEWRVLTEQTKSRGIVFYQGDPDAYMAGVILKEFVDRGQKALVYSGTHHAFTRYKQPVYDAATKTFECFAEARMGNLVYNRIGVRAFNIFLHSPWLGQEKMNDYVRPAGGTIDRVLAAFGQERVGFDVQASPFGSLGGASWYSHGYRDFTLAQFCDGYIYQGPLEKSDGVTVDSQFITRENFLDAIDWFENPSVRPWMQSPEVVLGWLQHDAEMVRRFENVK